MNMTALMGSFQSLRRQVETTLPDGGQTYLGHSILVTGAGGSIGVELCRQLLLARPRCLVLLDASELALYNLERTLSEAVRGGPPDLAQTRIVPILGSITDHRLVRTVLAKHRVEIVLHAAAYKHVPMVEANPLAGLENNVLGTRTMADAAIDAGVQKFVLISTDKAVRPTSLMGASKRLAELVVQDLARRSRTTVFTTVRFGNVLGSSGSVVPLFRDQIERGGPVTLTHEEVTRYFMTITEAVHLVLLAGSFADDQTSKGGDVFVLDMGKPIRIRDLAAQMIAAAGQTVRTAQAPHGDIEIVVTGLRPGEKLHEELLIGHGLLTTPHPKILRAREQGLSELNMACALRDLRRVIALGDSHTARAIAQTWVEGYKAPQGIVAAQ